MIKKLGIQSYCFRAFKQNAEVAALVKKCGLNVIELCAGAHFDPDDESIFDSVIGTYRQAGIRIASVYMGHLDTDEARSRKRFEFVRRAEARILSATFNIANTPDCYRVTERLCEEYDINVAIHNHGGYDWLGNSHSLAHVFRNTSPRIGLCLDTAWALAARQDPIVMAEEFKERLYGIHLKDFIFDRAGKPHDVVIGDGNLDLKKFIDTLKKVEFRGDLILEYEGDAENPVPALTKCVEALRKVTEL